jgi:hypothetical protein
MEIYVWMQGCKWHIIIISRPIIEDLQFF